MTREVSYAFKSKRYPFLSIYTALHKFFQFYQCNNMSVENYYNCFKSNIDILEHYGAAIGNSEKLIVYLLTKKSLHLHQL